MKHLDPYDLKCSICNKKFKEDDIVTVSQLPTGEPVAVHMRHHGAAGLVTNIVQITTGGVLRNIAYDIIEQKSPEHALWVIKQVIKENA